MEQNVPLSKEEAYVPSFYHIRPQQLTEHMAECMTTVNEFTADDVVLNSRLARGEFVVKSSQSDVQHKVHFGNDVVSILCNDGAMVNACSFYLCDILLV
jgi:hypothetical protein